MESNQTVFDRESSSYQSLALQPPEQLLLGLFHGRWQDIDMLDVGVGTGRTAYTFAPLTRNYLGIDYSPAMIELSRRRIRETPSVRFEVGDARQLSRYGAGRFDLVLFSFNGIDYVSHEDRLKILREIHLCMREDGVFYFSSHSLGAVPFRLPVPEFTRTQPIRWIYRFLRAGPTLWRLSAANRRMDVASLRRVGWALLRDEGHNFQLENYYILPAKQIEQLREAGFSVRAVYDLSATPIDPAVPPQDPWLYYLCDKAGEGTPR
jgi:SAM-dependent methyltransferase